MEDQIKQALADVDGVIIVTPEYNHGYTAVLKNALDYCFYEWNDKPVAFASYGGVAAGTLLAVLYYILVPALPALTAPGKFICVGLNYKTHVAEMKRADSEYPAIFTRFADSLSAHGAPLPKPSTTNRFDFEGELAVVIGKGGRRIAQADAFEHIAGYACFNDGTARDWQRHTHQWTPGKNFPATGPLGPFMATRQAIPDVNALNLQTRLNGEVMQSASLSDLIFTLPVIIEYLSGFTTLSPGDVIATGTPGGVGDKREPPVYMKAGDVIEVEITGLGTLRNTVVDEA